MLTTMPTDKQKAAVWDAYLQRKPTRVPLRYSSNPRVVLLDKQLNTHGYTFEQAAHDPQIHIEVALQHQLYLRTALNPCCDSPTDFPETWTINFWTYNVYEAASLGVTVQYPDAQVPCTEPILTDDSKYDIFEVDINHPLQCDYIQKTLHLWGEMDHICRDKIFEGRPVRLLPLALIGTDGPVTSACNLRGSDFLLELVEEPEYAQKLLTFLTQAAINRRDDFLKHWGDRLDVQANSMADDSCAMLSPKMYCDLILPHHKHFYDTGPALDRMMHLCGDVSHLLPIICEKLHVQSFDTGFPINHGQLRQQLGPDIEISGGTQIALLLNATANEVYERTREILTSGITEGGRFILQEGNNLPPCVPLDNLRAMYQACLEHGGYD